MTAESVAMIVTGRDTPDLLARLRARARAAHEAATDAPRWTTTQVESLRCLEITERLRRIYRPPRRSDSTRWT